MKQSKRALAVPVLFVTNPSPEADRTEAELAAKGLAVMRAENICYAEMYAEKQRFEAAVYDHTLSQEEQVSLARVMRVRWPWMRLIRKVDPKAKLLGDDAFDWSVESEEQLGLCIDRWLAM
jgi:hypothetical protein